MQYKKISSRELEYFYIKKQESAQKISRRFGCSVNKINYWLANYGILKRTISEAIYIKHNPEGDPFRFKMPKTLEEAKLFGMGLGLYWGEGNKANKNTVRLGNSDPALIKIFIDFLEKFFGINNDNLKFHLHLFSDIDIKEARKYWIKKLNIKKEQFYKPVISISGSMGTYKNKSKYGVLTVYYGNTKLKNLLISLLPM